MELKEGECRVYYKGKEKFLPFEKKLKQLFKDNGFECWASGYDMCAGVRDLCFEKKNRSNKQKLGKLQELAQKL